MARSHGRIQFTIWSNKEFRALTSDAQRMYLVLFGQKDVNNAGLLPLMVNKWAKYCESTTIADVMAALDELQAAGFIYYDDDTEELLIRSFIRNDGVLKQPNVFKNALKCAELIESQRLRSALARELRSLRRKDAEHTAALLDPNPSETLPEPFPKDSETVREPLNPSRTPLEPRGVGVEEEEIFCSADGDLGGRAHAHTRTREADAEQPSPHCPKHPDGTNDPCRPCGDARKHRADWDAEQLRARKIAVSTEARNRADLRAQAITACNLCDDDGYANGRPCDHDPDAADRVRRGIAAARAAITKPTQEPTE